MSIDIALNSKILIVDDTEMNLRILISALGDVYDVSVATDGFSAFELLEEELPDLILLDIMMPGMNGYEVCERLKADPRTVYIPIIFLTALTEIKAKSKGFEVGAVDYITKPFDIVEVKARVNTHVLMQRNLAELKKAHDAIEVQRKRMQLELDLGMKIQNNMLPVAFPDNKEFGLAAYLKPAKELGGDFYDFFFIDDEHLCFCVGDVSGKGVPAALFMAVSKTLIKSSATSELSPSKILQKVNCEISRDNEAMMFVSLFIGVLNIPTGEVLFSNGGHNSPFAVKSDGSVEEINEKHGMVLGFSGAMKYKEGRLLLGRGDSIVLYSDGITEAVNTKGEFYNESGLADSLLVEQSSVCEMLQNVLAKLDRFVGSAEQSDDITALILRYNGA